MNNDKLLSELLALQLQAHRQVHVLQTQKFELVTLCEVNFHVPEHMFVTVMEV